MESTTTTSSIPAPVLIDGMCWLTRESLNRVTNSGFRFFADDSQEAVGLAIGMRDQMSPGKTNHNESEQMKSQERKPTMRPVDMIESSTSQYQSRATSTACCIIVMILGSKILASPSLITSWQRTELAICMDTSISEALPLFSKFKLLGLTDKNGYLRVDEVIQGAPELKLKTTQAFFGYMESIPVMAQGYDESLQQCFLRISAGLVNISVFSLMCSAYTFLVIFSTEGCFYADSHPKTKRGVLRASKGIWVRFSKPEDMAAHFVALFTPFSLWEIQSVIQV